MVALPSHASNESGGDHPITGEPFAGTAVLRVRAAAHAGFGPRTYRWMVGAIHSMRSARLALATGCSSRI
jgi:hypothetical protein